MLFLCLAADKRSIEMMRQQFAMGYVPLDLSWEKDSDLADWCHDRDRYALSTSGDS